MKTAIRSAMTGDGEYGWRDVMGELIPIITNPLTVESEQLLLDVLKFEGKLKLTVSHDMPHSLSPTDMLKFLAAQALTKWTGRKYIDEMGKIQKETLSPSLASRINHVIKGAE